MSDPNRHVNTILIIEDEYTIRETMKEALELEGYNVVTAVNGEDGLAKIRQLPKPCLVLLDMIMPIMNGRQFLDAVLADAILAPIPVVIVSASLGNESSHGSVEIVKKPVDLDTLLKLVALYAQGLKKA